MASGGKGPVHAGERFKIYMASMSGYISMLTVLCSISFNFAALVLATECRGMSVPTGLELTVHRLFFHLPPRPRVHIAEGLAGVQLLSHGLHDDEPEASH